MCEILSNDIAVFEECEKPILYVADWKTKRDRKTRNEFQRQVTMFACDTK